MPEVGGIEKQQQTFRIISVAIQESSLNSGFWQICTNRASTIWSRGRENVKFVCCLKFVVGSGVDKQIEHPETKQLVFKKDPKAIIWTFFFFPSTYWCGPPFSPGRDRACRHWWIPSFWTPRENGYCIFPNVLFFPQLNVVGLLVFLAVTVLVVIVGFYLSDPLGKTATVISTTGPLF